MRTLLVGSFAQKSPPALLLLEALPQGTLFRLQPEPDNPYDASALRVMVMRSELDETTLGSEDFAIKAASHGLAVVEIPEEFCIGHCASSTGKPLRKVQEHFPEVIGTLELAAAGLASGIGAIEFGGEGKIWLDVEPAGPGELP